MTQYFQILSKWAKLGKKNNEIDIVVDYPGIKKILIEVKYREKRPSITHEYAIPQMSEEASSIFIITKNSEDFGVQKFANGAKIISMPAYAFLYLLGHAEKNGYKGNQ